MNLSLSYDRRSIVSPFAFVGAHLSFGPIMAPCICWEWRFSISAFRRFVLKTWGMMHDASMMGRTSVIGGVFRALQIHLPLALLMRTISADKQPCH